MAAHLMAKQDSVRVDGGESSMGDPGIAALSNGWYAVVWTGETDPNVSTRVWYQLLDPNGARAGGVNTDAMIAANGTSIGSQYKMGLPQIAALSADGKFVVSYWDHTIYDGTFHYQKHYDTVVDASGGPLVAVSNAQDPDPPHFPLGTNGTWSDVAALPNGGFVAAWKELGFHESIYAQAYDANGSSIGPQQIIDGGNGGNPVTVYTSNPSVAVLGADRYVVVWTGVGDSGHESERNIHAKIVNAGVAGADFLVNTVTPGTQTLSQNNHSVAALTGGGFVVVWTDDSGTLGDASGKALHAQVFDGNGAKVGDEFRVNTSTDLDQTNAEAAPLANGGFIVTWTGASGTTAQLFDSSGTMVGPETHIASGSSPSVAVQANGDIAFAWYQDVQGVGTIQSQLFTVATRTTANDVNGDARSDVLFIQPGVNFDSDYLWQMNDRAISGQAGIDLFDKAFSVQVTGDFNGDGKADVLFENPTTAGVWEWQLDGSTISAQGAVDVGDPSYHILGTADFNGDGMSDVLWRSDTGLLYQWQMNGTSDTGAALGTLDPSVWHVVGAGDFTGDGKADILFHYHNGANAADPANGAFDIWQMDGSAVTATLGVERPDPSWKILGVGDFNGDGISDIAIRNVSATPDNGAVWVYLMAGTITTHPDTSKTADILAQGAAGIADAATWHVQEIGDLDGDGKDDILFRNDAGYFYSWDMNGTTIASEGSAGTEAGDWADPSLQVVTQHWDVA